MRKLRSDTSWVVYAVLVSIMICGFVSASGGQNISSGSKMSGDIGSAEFDFPQGIAVDSAGNVYVADTGNDRIQKFSSDGTYLLAWGSHGKGPGEFDSPDGIAVDSAGNVYVADTGNDRIQKFSSDGTYLLAWGSHGLGPGEFDNPRGIAVDSAGNVHVTDTGNYRIQKFSSDGTYLLMWAHGTGGGTFDILEGIAVDSSGNVCVQDHDWIQKFSSDGKYLFKWGFAGTGPGQFSWPHGIAVDSAGNVYVADTQNYRIQKFSSDGTYLLAWGSHGLGPGEFDNPRGIAVDPAGNVYVTDTGNGRIQKFSSDGTYLLMWGSPRNFTELLPPTGIMPHPVCTPPACECGHLECKEENNCPGGCGYACVETKITTPPDWTASVSATKYQNLKIGDTAIISVSEYGSPGRYSNISVSVNSFNEYKPNKELTYPERCNQGTWYKLQLKCKNAGDREEATNPFYSGNGILVDSKGNEIPRSGCDDTYSVSISGGVIVSEKIVYEPQGSSHLRPGIWNYNNLTYVFSDDATSGLPSYSNMRDGAVFHFKNRRCLDTTFSTGCCPYDKIVEDDISWVVAPLQVNQDPVSGFICFIKKIFGGTCENI
jgi:DNA-binding beta-propeller fold protein YncE